MGDYLFVMQAQAKDLYPIVYYCLHPRRRDYHKEMDSVRFKKWFEESLLPNIPEIL